MPEKGGAILTVREERRYRQEDCGASRCKGRRSRWDEFKTHQCARLEKPDGAHATLCGAKVKSRMSVTSGQRAQHR